MYDLKKTLIFRGNDQWFALWQKLPSESDIESYAHQHLNRHKKGLFGKKVSINNMLTWSKVNIITHNDVTRSLGVGLRQ